MDTLLWLLLVLCFLGSLVCFILVMIQMFQRGKTGLAIASIVLSFCCCIGQLIALVYGWMNAKAWGIENIMVAYTACFVGYIVVYIIAVITGVVNIGMPQLPQ